MSDLYIEITEAIQDVLNNYAYILNISDFMDTYLIAEKLVNYIPNAIKEAEKEEENDQ